MPIRVLALALSASVHPQDEEENDQDREADQPDQAQERREAGRRAHGWSRPAPWAFLGCLPGVRLLEEVELDVVSLAHFCARSTGLGAASLYRLARSVQEF